MPDQKLLNLHALELHFKPLNAVSHFLEEAIQMLQPDFCESQLQTVCNMEICTLLGNRSFPIIPSLVEEKELGWDSGFIISGGSTPAPDQKGCNFFIQYKLSDLLEGPRGGQYQYWNAPYFRFRIPHSRRDGGWYYKDYHQYHRLKALSNRHYLVLYVANSVMVVQDLLQHSVHGLDAITSAVNIADINTTHEFITYTATSNHVMLHSEPVKAPKLRVQKISELIKVSPATTFEEDLLQIPKVLFGEEVSLLKNFTLKHNLTSLENWARMTTLIYIFAGVRTYKWFPAMKKTRRVKDN